MSSQSEQSLIETEALAWSDTEVMNADGNDGMGGECIHFFLSFHPEKNTVYVDCNQTTS